MCQSFLIDEYSKRIVDAYKYLREVPGFTRQAILQDVQQQNGNLNIRLCSEAAPRETDAEGEDGALSVALEA